jgi:SAM-dependent methyltransferase|tara:strand:- start:921 stop:1787 length:867 start_codon:yes stop_codon:yes gene_type:complete
MEIKKIQNKNTFRFFNYKWKKVPTWASQTEKKYVNWYLQRYKYKSLKNLKAFLSNKKDILDAGCGLARDTKLFAKLNKSANVYGCDQSLTAIKKAKQDLKKFKNVYLFQQDITKKIKFNKKFDFISCDQVLHHTPNPGKTLKNLFSSLKKNGYLNFFVCKKKNVYRDYIDDHIMNHFRNKSPKELWDFAIKVTNFAKSLYDLQINNLKFNKKKYDNLQLFVHNNTFRTWYDPKIKFDLSVSSNYDWFSNNPRYNLQEMRKIISSNLSNYKFVTIYEDDASISISIKKN